MRFRKYVSSVVDGRKYHYYTVRDANGCKLPGDPIVNERYCGRRGWYFSVSSGESIDDWPDLASAKAFIRENFWSA